MKIAILGISLLSGLQEVAAHYFFDRVSVNGGSISKKWQHIRNVTTGAAYDYVEDCPTCQMQMTPYYDVYDNNFRCGRNATLPSNEIETLTVNAGDELAFWAGYREQFNPIAHTGPGQAYLSRVPGEGRIEQYEGDGDWFKVGYIGAQDDTHWVLRLKDSMNFTIPATTPPGKYLMRVEHSYPQMLWNETQWYVNCAHLEIKGPGGGTPGPMVKFPGAYDVWDPTYWAPYWVYGEVNLTKYTPPGPQVWKG